MAKVSQGMKWGVKTKSQLTDSAFPSIAFLQTQMETGLIKYLFIVEWGEGEVVQSALGGRRFVLPTH